MCSIMLQQQYQPLSAFPKAVALLAESQAAVSGSPPCCGWHTQHMWHTTMLLLRDTDIFCFAACPDLVLPAWVGVAFHGTWTSLIAAEVAIIGLPDDCEGRRLATSSVLWLLLSFALTTFLQCVVAGISMRGEGYLSAHTLSDSDTGSSRKQCCAVWGSEQS
jgi:hypothetical protein